MNDSTRLFQEVKARANLADYIALAAGGGGKRVGSALRFNPCPFCGHNDCFHVFGEAQAAWKCHSCGESGDIFTFAERKLGFTKGESLREVARFAGVALPALAPQHAAAPAASAAKGGAKPADNTLQLILEASVAHYRQVLSGRQEMMAWLTAPKSEKGRGHNAKTLDALEVGASDGRLAEALQAQGFTLDQVKAAGLYTEKKGKPGEWRDFFLPGLAVFPHRLPSGEVAHFTIKDPRKQIDYQFRSEHRVPGLTWGNQKAIRLDPVILCEGENDLASFFDAGVRNVLASLGSVSDEQIRWLETHAGGKHFVLWFDYDVKLGANGRPPAGISYTRKVYQRLLRAGAGRVTVASALMDPGEDPDDWIQKDLESAPRRIQAAVKSSTHPLIWELRVMPEELRENNEAAISYLQELEFFEYLGMVPGLMRDAVVTAMQKLGFSRDTVLDSIKQGYDLREQLGTVLESFNGSTRTDSYKRTVATAVWDYFKVRGKFFVDGEALHLFYHHIIYQIGDNTPFKSLMQREAGINYKQDVAGFVWEELKALCYNRGDRLSAAGWIALVNDEGAPTLYLNLKDPSNRILKVSQAGVDLVQNGTNANDMLLAESEQMKPFRYDAEVNVAAGMRTLKETVLNNLSCDPAQRYLLLAWALSAYLLPFCETRALMKMEGMSESGKTTSAKLLSLLLYGENMVGRSSTASDYSMASTEPLIIKDNLETDDINRNALNFLLLAATGATNIKRSHGTDSGVTLEKINCLVAITAIEPFAKPELINRALILDFSKKYHRPNFLEEDTIATLTARRDEILSSWLRVLAERVLPHLEDRRKVVMYLRQQHGDFAKARVSEFIALLTLITKALVHYMPLPEDLKLQAGGRPPEYVLLDAWVKYQNEHSRAAEQGTNAILRLLDGLRRVFLIDFSRKAEAHQDSVWCELMGCDVHRENILDAAGVSTGHQTYWFRASTQDLLSMMQRYAREYGVRVGIESAHQLGSRIGNEMQTLEGAGWKPERLGVLHGDRTLRRWQWSEMPILAPETSPKPPEKPVELKLAPNAQ